MLGTLLSIGAKLAPRVTSVVRALGSRAPAAAKVLGRIAASARSAVKNIATRVSVELKQFLIK